MGEGENNMVQLIQLNHISGNLSREIFRQRLSQANAGGYLQLLMEEVMEWALNSAIAIAKLPEA
jgi:hypothetical protein